MKHANNTGTNGSPGKHVLGLRYALKRMLARGELGEVWLAWDREREREVALKFLPQSLLADSSSLGKVRAELELIFQLQHSAIASIYDFLHDSETVALGTEFVPGWSLAVLRLDRPQRRYSVEEVRPWAMQVCAALEHAHGRGVVHGGLKQANLLLDIREQIKVTDFGIGYRLRQALGRHRYPGASALPYLSPQQIEGAAPAVADDIYALGAVLYELLTGTPPFYTGNILKEIRQLPPPPMTGRLVQLDLEGVFPERWEQIVAACLAKDPARRPTSAREVFLALELEPESDRGAESVSEQSDATSGSTS